MSGDDLKVEVAALKAFKTAVLGWREYDRPEWFDRSTADLVIAFGEENEQVERSRTG